MSRRRALFLVPEAPYPAHSGGSMRSACLFEYLAERYEMDVIAFRESGSPDPATQFPTRFFADILVLDLPRHRKDPVSRAARNAGRVARGIPPLVDRFRGFGNAITGFVAGRHYAVAVVEHLWCGPYLEVIAPVSEKTVLDLHNIESVLHERCAADETGPAAFAHHLFAQWARELEACWLPRYNLVLTASIEDEKIAGAIAPGARIAVFPNAIPLVLRPSIAERDVVAFSGNLEYHPNVGAVRYFHREIWPALREKWPALVWRLIGKNESAVRNEIGVDDRIEFSGPVVDAIEELAGAKVVVVPLLAGSGTRFKLLEAWAAGRAVVSTAMGAEGLPARHGENVLIADGAVAFGDSVSRLLTDAGLRARLGETGRALFESEFTWDSAWRQIDL